MKKTRYTEEQIAFALKQAETGTAYRFILIRLDVYALRNCTGTPDSPGRDLLA